MSRTLQTEQQLQGMALSADRANRPRMLVIIPALLLLGAALTAIASAWNMNTQAQRLTNSERTRDSALKTMAGLEAERASIPKLHEMFERDPLLAATIRQYGQQVFSEAGIEDEFPDPAPRERGYPAGGEHMTRTSTPTTLHNQPLTPILTFVDRVLQDPDNKFVDSDNLYLASFDLNPVAGADTWNATIAFETYEYE